MNYTCFVIVRFELNFVGGQKRKGVKNMKMNEETRFYYFIPYERSSRGYNRLCYAVSTLSGDKTALEFIQDLMLIPEYKSVEFFEVFYRSDKEWSKLNYFDTFRVVSFDNLNITISQNSL